MTGLLRRARGYPGTLDLRGVEYRVLGAVDLDRLDAVRGEGSDSRALRAAGLVEGLVLAGPGGGTFVAAVDAEGAIGAPRRIAR